MGIEGAVPFSPSAVGGPFACAMRASLAALTLVATIAMCEGVQTSDTRGSLSDSFYKLKIQAVKEADDVNALEKKWVTLQAQKMKGGELSMAVKKKLAQIKKEKGPARAGGGKPKKK